MIPMFKDFISFVIAFFKRGNPRGVTGPRRTFKSQVRQIQQTKDPITQTMDETDLLEDLLNNQPSD